MWRSGPVDVKARKVFTGFWAASGGTLPELSPLLGNYSPVYPS